MCEDCGCGDPALVAVEVQESLLAGYARVARHSRVHFLEHGVHALNLMGSPGSGKTALLEATARAHTGLRIAAVSGDLATRQAPARLCPGGRGRAGRGPGRRRGADRLDQSHRWDKVRIEHFAWR